MTAHENLLRMENIVKDFPGIRALGGVDFTLQQGQIHGLVGSNGAGKSTLIKVLGGLYSDYSGQICFQGQEVNIRTPKQATDLGIAVIHQEFSLVRDLTVAENIMLGREPLNKRCGLPFTDWRELYAEVELFLDKLGFDLPIRAKISDLGVAQQQLVQVAKALICDARILVMDEPTARLSNNERADLFAIMNQLRDSGVGIIYISHFLEEIFMIADHITVLRDGKVIESKPASELDHATVVRLMIGREVAETPVDIPPHSHIPVLQVRNLTDHERFHDISFTLFKGEILGLAGLVGAGRTELARALFGASQYPLEGEIMLDGKPFYPSSPHEVISRGLALLPEDRKEQGLILEHSVLSNLTLTTLERLTRGLLIDATERKGLADRIIDLVQVKATNPQVLVNTLSGGNQQKVVLGKWLAVHPKILILDQPTAGIDVGTKAEIYRLMEQLVKDGMSLIVISDEPEELARVCQRILIMRKGRIVKELVGPSTSEEVLAGVTAEY
ncbi:MAG: sugar ABC transporter ATP-binding protein [Firmicutes bacterium]|nr:sugar ABC transporter ATP-binding protein [Bacillota bacterium]